MSDRIKIGKRVKISGPPSNNTVYGKVTKYKIDSDSFKVTEYKVVFEDKTYGVSDWFPVEQVKEVK